MINIPKIIQNYSVSKYFIVGITAFATDYLLLIIFYYVFNVPLGLSTSIGFFAGFVVSFGLNKQWTFSGSQSKAAGRQLVEYIILLLFNYIFTVYAVGFSNDRGIAPAISKIIIMCLIMCWNYVLFNRFIFKRSKTF